MSAKKKSSGKTSGKKTGAKKTAAPKRRATTKRKPAAFPEALAELLRKRRLKVPDGLVEAPPEAYARQPASFASRLADLDDDALALHAEKVASYARRQAERAERAWDTSPLIGEIRRRKLKEPPRPRRVVGAVFSLKKPLREWTDAELLDAARQWSERGG